MCFGRSRPPRLDARTPRGVALAGRDRSPATAGRSTTVDALRRRVAEPARVAQILVKAHRTREAIEEGRCANATAAATAWGLSRNRMSQVLALTYLAPDIQLESWLSRQWTEDGFEAFFGGLRELPQ